MRKSGAALIMALLITAAAGILSDNSVLANPFTNSQYSGQTGVPSGAPSPTVSIFYPENNKAYNTHSITLNFNASVEEFLEADPTKPLVTGMRIVESFFTADWLPNETQIEIAPYLNVEGGSNHVSVSLNLTGIPEGKHVLRVFVSAEGRIVDPFHWYNFDTVGNSRVNFTVDTTPPIISVSPIDNQTHVESELSQVSLNFTLNEPAVRISYVLDGTENMTIDGNTTLSGLRNGKHGVKIYAWDAAGNVGASETVSFTVAEPESFPTVPVAAVSAASITAVGAAGLLLTHRKRRREAQQT